MSDNHEQVCDEYETFKKTHNTIEDFNDGSEGVDHSVTLEQSGDEHANRGVGSELVESNLGVLQSEGKGKGLQKDIDVFIDQNMGLVH